MKWLSGSSPRRTLLRRGLLAAGGLVGLAAGRQVSARGEGTSGTPAPGTDRQLRFYGRGAMAGGAGKPGTTRVVRRFELVETPDGPSAGEFVATALGAEASFGAQGVSLSALELQTFRLGEDTLFGIGALGARGSERAYAVLGGTGRFAGARGTCLERTLEGGGSLRGQVEFLLTLVG